ncbi:MAG: response regulator [Candidatus Methanoperedens sp.]|nr:response regulator [Candidatus Methanoperedens sp.]
MSNKKLKYLLIVNSEPDIADLFAEMLLMDIEKYIINTAYTGKDCLLTLKRDRPDMVLLDLELSDMDGWELVEKIKESKPDIPIVIVTSKIPGVDDFTRLSMVSDYLMKPVTIDCLYMAVRDALEIPALVENCIKTLKGFNEIDRALLEKNIRLLRQSISDRKFFIMMRQLYPERKAKNETGIMRKLEALKIKIDREHSELEDFKKRCLIA